MFGKSSSPQRLESGPQSLDVSSSSAVGLMFACPFLARCSSARSAKEFSLGFVSPPNVLPAPLRSVNVLFHKLQRCHRNPASWMFPVRWTHGRGRSPAPVTPADPWLPPGASATFSHFPLEPPALLRDSRNANT